MEPQDDRRDQAWDLARLRSSRSAPSVRADGVARLLQAIDDPGRAGTVQLLVGDAGIGRSTLLDALARDADARGSLVLRARGSEAERGLAFATLHQLLRPVTDRIDTLPERQRPALRSAMGTGPGTDAAGPDVMATGDAVLGLLSDLAARQPVLVLLDDAHRCDRSSLDALAFAARRLRGEHVTLLLAAETGHTVGGFERDVPVTVLAPLDDAEAAHLLEGLPVRAAARLAADVLEQAAGSPLALVELSRAAAQDPAGHRTAAGPLPVGDQVARTFGGWAHGLPHATRQALLCLAATDPVDAAIAPVPARAPHDVWEPAERAGLVVRTGGRVRFRHPLVRAAIYQTAAPDDRRAAHEAVAELLHDEPDRRAWHLAAARTGQDAATAELLERTAEQARQRGGHAAAAKALHRAAELTPHAEHAGRLLVEAARSAVPTGDLAWVEQLAHAVRTRTGDASLTAAAAVHVGRLTVLTARHTTAFTRLTQFAARFATTRPESALRILADAAVARFYSGREAELHAIHDLLRRIPEHAGQEGLRAWVRIVCDPVHAGRADLRTLRAQPTAGDRDRPEQLTYLGIAAWLLDQTPEAVDAFDLAFDVVPARDALPNGLGGAAAWAYLERGRWDRAREVSARIVASGTAAGLDHAAACATAVDAMVLALRGDVRAARARAARAVALVDPLESRSVSVYARRALAAAASAEGDHETAYRHLRTVFTAHGDPLHYHASYAALADFAAAAVRIGSRQEAAGIVESAARRLGDDASARLRALLHRARGLLAEPASAEPHLRAALAEPVTEHWPFERAQALLDLAEWLRRRRRVAEARAPLAEALETFRRLGAEPWLERALAESRAAGVDVGTATSEALADLSPQQQEIVRLAARGLTNREIGERLFISPRTVGSHLYRTFPRLGVTARAQLRAVVDGV
ncbi:helix-turn-helix transcriptional regulator [Promicromonospora thailandica]|uniref:Regulatory protein, luxR family n=1 Tax=Promicromonospora thailandica TaxID=765201 RepID=A0A9X2JWZ0_9MICO|nr:LuxR family transcriptional regulator [Promicromonospora thailandica]MCP2265653.1 regulatory protein, luxR family [Promicromonospora thailandica]